MVALSTGVRGAPDAPRRSARGRPVQPWGSYWGQTVYASPVSADGRQTRSRNDPKASNVTTLAEWHTPPDLLTSDLRSLLYPYATTLCVIRDPAARLASAVYYQMDMKDRAAADARDAASFNAHIRDRLAKQLDRGHQTLFWPQVYFTPPCDVTLRFESLKRDFDGLMVRTGCPLRLPRQQGEYRGNRLVPLLAADVVATVRRMYAADYALFGRLAGMGLDELLANATN